MKKPDELLNEINFKKAIKAYIAISVILLVLCSAVSMYIIRDKIKLAVEYTKVSESFKHNGLSDELKPRLPKLLNESNDLINCIAVDKDNNIIYKANSNLIMDSNKFILTAEKSDKRYVRDNINSNVIYKVEKEENIIFNKDYIKNHEKILSDIDENFYYEKDLEDQNINLINYVVNKQTKEKLFIIRNVTAIPYAGMLMDAVGGIIGLIFVVYWLGVALWVYKDANRKRCNPALWGLIVLLTNLIGLIIYTMYKQTNKVCYKCGSLQNKDNAFCDVCGTQINERCANCNSIINRGQEYCSSCGHKL